MMVIKQKQKGTAWENLLVELIENNIHNGKAKRIAGSGAIGTAMEEPLLTGDVIASFPGFDKKFRIEAKVGYGGATQLAIKREWFNKISEEAHNSYSIPALACKFSGARKKDGIQYFIALDFQTFCDIINYVGELKRELDLSYMDKERNG